MRSTIGQAARPGTPSTRLELDTRLPPTARQQFDQPGPLEQPTPKYDIQAIEGDVKFLAISNLEDLLILTSKFAIN